MALDDKELILRSIEDDHSAFEELVHRYDRIVLSIALRYSRDEDDAKDIYQEVFIRVYKGLKNFQFRSEFSTWLYRIATNVCITYKTRSKEHLQLSTIDNDENDESIEQQIVYDGISPEEESVNKNIGDIVNAAVESLSPKQKMTFVLKHYEGYKIREIAEMLECKEGTVKKYLFDAVNNLKKKLKPVSALQNF